MDEIIDLIIDEIDIGKSIDDYHTVSLQTNRGEVSTRFYHVPNLKKAVIFVGGVRGGFDTPAGDLYPSMASQLVIEGISSLWIKYRNPSDLVESVIDVIAGISFLNQNGIKEIGLVGHSFGSAVIVQAAANLELIKTIVCLSTQSYGMEAASNLSEDTSLLLVHGKNDKFLHYASSEYAYEIAHQSKKLVLLDGAGHGLMEARDGVYRIVHDWLIDKMKKQNFQISPI